MLKPSCCFDKNHHIIHRACALGFLCLSILVNNAAFSADNADNADSADSTDSADSADSTDSADSADSTDSADSHLLDESTAEQLVRAALAQWRGQSSYGEVTMVIHRPDWERRMSLQSWTRGDTDALIRFTAPAKDAGNATLKLNNHMWMFTPKLNQVIQLPASMMAQSWMGSDFSYNDLAKSDQIITDFTLTLRSKKIENQHHLYLIEALPKPDAPVVWGKEILLIRDDHILLLEQFYDQSQTLVREMKTLTIAPLGGREYPVVMRMTNTEEPDHWTEVTTTQAQFNQTLPDFLFTQANLRNPRPWNPLKTGSQ